MKKTIASTAVKEVTYFSNDENFPLKTKTKPLAVNIEFEPDSKYLYALSIEEIPNEIYTDEQNEFINKAVNSWRKK